MNERGGDQMTLEIRPMSIDDLKLTLDWAAAEGWNPGLDDAAPFLAADPDGFLMGWVDGEPAVSIAAVAYGTDYGFVGLYICREEYRGHGHGAALARAGLTRLEGRTIGLDGVVARIENYARLGFEAAHRSLRFGGAIHAEWPSDPRLVEIGEDHLAGKVANAIVRLDRAFFPADREAFVRAWIAPTATRRAVALVDGDMLTGYGVIRACGEGSKIGPLFAISPEDAETMLRALASLQPGPVFLDVPEPNAAGLALAERHGMSVQFETVRMYRGPVPELPLGETYGITSFELG